MNTQDHIALDDAFNHVELMQSQRTSDKRLLDEVVPTQTQPVPTIQGDWQDRIINLPKVPFDTYSTEIYPTMELDDE